VIPASRKKAYLNRVEYYPLTPHDLMGQTSEIHLKVIVQALRTFHNYFHITHKTVDHAQRLSNSHPSLILGQSIQSLHSGFYLAVAQQLLRELLYGKLNHG
jgi:hypothetical protein